MKGDCKHLRGRCDSSPRPASRRIKLGINPFICEFHLLFGEIPLRQDTNHAHFNSVALRRGLEKGRGLIFVHFYLMF